VDQLLGIDIGGSGIKGAVVDLERGIFATERLRIETPQPSTPTAVANVVSELIEVFDCPGNVGCTFPAVVRRGIVESAANVDRAWVGVDVASVLAKRTDRHVVVLNDADAAGLAEVRFGAGASVEGVVVMVTLGTGIGTAVFVDGRLVPNTELGHIIVDGVDAETMAASRWRDEHGLTWEEWGERVNRYLARLEQLIWPDLIIIGGGVSRRHKKFFPYLDISTPVVPAELRNSAGIIGAAFEANTRG